MQKNKLAKQCHDFDHGQDILAVKLDIGGVTIDLYLEKDASKEAFSFLRNYYQPFLRTENGKADVSIYYRAFNNEWRDPCHPLWNEPDQEIHFSDDQDGRLLWLRDVVAWISPDGTLVKAQGPLFHTGAIDVLDNLITPSLGSFLLKKNVLHVHASCVEVDGKAWVFFGPSGAGKSTMAMNSLANHRYRVLSGDQTFLQFKNGQWWALPTSVTIYQLNRSKKEWCPDLLPLNALIFLNGKDMTYAFKRLSTNDLISAFLKENIYFGTNIAKERLLSLTLELLSFPAILKGSLAYVCGQDPWPRLLKEKL